MDAKTYPVWQLTDGTVVIQGANIDESKLSAGDFEWIDPEKRARRPVRAAVMRLVEKL
jgi:hypothetical protein